MPKFSFNPFSKGGMPSQVFNKSKKIVSDFASGTPESQEYISRLSPEQQPLANQAINAGLGPGAGGAYGSAADYYYNNLSDNPADFEAFAAPERRIYNEQIIPGLSEQFAGMGAGGLSSSGFRNAAVSAGTDLSERLAQIRSNLRSQSAQGLQNIGNAGLQSFGENVIRPGTPGFLESFAPAIGTAIGSFAGPAGAAAGNAVGQGTQSWLSQSRKGKSSPYGNQQIGQQGFQLPNFNSGMR